MRRTEESGAYLGGIVAMLEVADGCPRCGKRHSRPRGSFRERGPIDCPSVVFGSFPVMRADSLALDELPPTPASQRIRDFEVPIAGSPGMVPAALSPTRGVSDGRTRRLAIPWLPPPDLGEVF